MSREEQKGRRGGNRTSRHQGKTCLLAKTSLSFRDISNLRQINEQNLHEYVILIQEKVRYATTFTTITFTNKMLSSFHLLVLVKRRNVEIKSPSEWTCETLGAMMMMMRTIIWLACLATYMHNVHT